MNSRIRFVALLHSLALLGFRVLGLGFRGFCRYALLSACGVGVDPEPQNLLRRSSVGNLYLLAGPMTLTRIQSRSLTFRPTRILNYYAKMESCFVAFGPDRTSVKLAQRQVFDAWAGSEMLNLFVCVYMWLC